MCAAAGMCLNVESCIVIDNESMCLTTRLNVSMCLTTILKKSDQTEQLHPPEPKLRLEDAVMNIN